MKHKKLVAHTGAGISKESGIPTFEELGDIRDKLSRDYYNNHRLEFFKLLDKLYTVSNEAEPNAAHRALALYNVPIITMNVDGLHKRAGSDNLIEIHGSLEMVYCEECGREYPFITVRKTINCLMCNGRLQPKVVLYGDAIPKLQQSFDMLDDIDDLLIIGTSFYTSTAHYMMETARDNGAEVTIINEDAGVRVPEFLDEYYR